MKTILLLLILISGSCSGQVTWQKCYDYMQNVDFGYSIQETFDKGFIIAGHTDPGGGTERNLYLIKTDINGDTLWTKIYTGNENLVANSIQQTTDSGYIITGYYGAFGTNQNIIYLAKTNSSGDTIWTRTFGGINDQNGSSVIQSNDGGYVVIGSTNSFGAGDYDIYLIKTDLNGNTLWTKIYGGVNSDLGADIKQTSDSGYIITGTTSSFDTTKNIYLVKINSSGDTLWTKTYGGVNNEGSSSIQQTRDNGFIIVGSTNSFGAGDYDIYLIRTNAGGDTLWTKTFGGVLEDNGVSVQKTFDNGFIITGYTKSFGSGGYDAYLVKTDSSGNLMWSKSFGGPLTDFGRCVQQATDTGFVICGVTWSFGIGIYDTYFIKTDANGNSGCNESNTSSITNSTSTVVNNWGAMVSSGTGGFHIAINIQSGSTISNICSSTSVSENEISSSDISIFPNPTINAFTIINIPSKQNILMQIINPQGEILYSEVLYNKNSHVINANFAMGIYFVKIYDGVNIIVRKLIVE